MHTQTVEQAQAHVPGTKVYLTDPLRGDYAPGKGQGCLDL